MIWNSAQDVIYNGATVYGVYANGVKVWPPAPQLFNVECYGKGGTSSVAIGLTASRYDEVLFEQSPTTGSFSATGLPADTKLVCRIIVPSGCTATYIESGLTASSKTRSSTTAGEAIGEFVYKPLQSDAMISGIKRVLNDFSASGNFMRGGGTLTSWGQWDVLPAYITNWRLLAGQPQVTAFRTMKYQSAGVANLQSSIRTFNTAIKYSAVNVDAHIDAYFNKWHVTDYTLSATAKVFNGISTAQKTGRISAAQNSSIVLSTGLYKNYNGTSFVPSGSFTGGCNIYIGTYMQTYPESSSYRYMYDSASGFWSASGIIL
jgi:hypothetical protein